MDGMRRTLLKGAGAAGAVGVAFAAGLLKPGVVYAMERNATAFDSQDLSVVLKASGADGATESSQITVKAPDIAENGAVVPVEITSNLPDTESIAIIGEKNGFPMIADFGLMNGALGYVSIRIKMAETSKVLSVVKAGGKLYKASKEVKVTIGGCGG